MSKTEMAEEIALRHGCVILPASNGRTAIQVLGRYQQGWPQDADRIAAARRDIETELGLSTDEWLW